MRLHVPAKQIDITQVPIMYNDIMAKKLFSKYTNLVNDYLPTLKIIWIMTIIKVNVIKKK